jgi:hypothetical protein
MSHSLRHRFPRALAIRAIAALVLAACAFASQAQDAAPAGTTPTPSPTSKSFRVLFLGNSLTYVNDLPATLRALAAAQPTPAKIETQTFVAPGGSLAERWDDGKAAAALGAGHWDAVVLQERGGLLACMVDPAQRTQPDCRASERAHKEFAARAKAAGARVLLLSTWGPDTQYQSKLDRAAKQLASRIDARVVPAGATLRTLAQRNGDKATFPDGIHPSVLATLVMAVQLHEAIVGAWPQATDVTLDFALLPANAAIKPDTPMESQSQLKGDGRKVLVKADAIAAAIEAAK